MNIENPNDYKFIRFEISRKKSKKYDGLIQHKKTGIIKRIGFGQLGAQQYKDSTDLGPYSHLDHLDEERKKNYYLRFGKEAKKYSAKWFAHNYLWM